MLLFRQNHMYENKNLVVLKQKLQRRNGLYLVECKKNRFEPSLALALTLQKEDVKQSYTYHETDQAIQKYIHGEAIEGSQQKGYGVIFVEDFPLSFYKESQHQAKNLYPKGLRR